MTQSVSTDLANIARRHGLSEVAVQAALDALRAGHGRQAQFNHPELGGMGQWSVGGMLMIGDMFNNALKAKVAALFDDLAPLGALPADPASTESAGSRWPAELGRPSSTGSQNQMHYAIFPEKRRVAVEQDGKTVIYDMGDHLLGGVGQQQGGAQTLSFSGPNGPVALADLKIVSGSPADSHRTAPSRPETEADQDIAARIEKLHDLLTRGALTQDEYDAAKRKLLDRL